jgi:hypothetical protein
MQWFAQPWILYSRSLVRSFFPSSARGRRSNSGVGFLRWYSCFLVQKGELKISLSFSRFDLCRSFYKKKKAAHNDKKEKNTAAGR